MDPDVTRRAVLRHGVGMVGAAALASGTAGAQDGDVGPVQVVPEAAEEFVASPLSPVDVPTALAFGPGSGPGDLYAPTLNGAVRRLHLQWTDAGPVVRDTSVAAEGFDQPLGIAFLERGPPDHANGPPDHADGPGEDPMIVTDSHANENTGRTDGYVVLIDGDDRQVIVDGLPNGRHNTNHVAVGPDDRLYITNGNTTDNGLDGGDPEVFPYSGAILAVDVEEVQDEPAVLQWVDEEGDPIEDENENGILEEVAEHPVNADFRETVDVVAHGFRNVYGVAIGPDGVPYTGMNGADDPPSPDGFYRLDEPEGTDYGYPFCYNDGPVGGTGDEVEKVPNPTFEGQNCEQYPTADAIMGWHVCATGLDFPHETRRGPDGGGPPGESGDDRPFAFPEAYRDDAFVGECTPFMGQDLVEKSVNRSVSTRNTSHKVTHVYIQNGEVVELRDFLTGLALPTDVRFGPQGAMYVADLEGIYRVQPRPGPSV